MGMRGESLWLGERVCVKRAHGHGGWQREGEAWGNAMAGLSSDVQVYLFK